MSAVSARLRFGARPSSTVPRFTRGDSVRVWADFYDPLTGSAVAVSTVAARAWLPGGATLSPAPTVAEDSTGTWHADITPAYSGEWRVEFTCAVPDAAAAARSFLVIAPDPDPGPPPDATWPEVEELRDQAQVAKAQAEAAAAAAAASAAAAGPAGAAAGAAAGATAGATAGAVAAATRTWDRIELRSWMEARGYVWGSSADASPHLNALLAQAVEGGAMSGKVVIVPPGLLACSSALQVQPYTRNIAFVADGNTRWEYRFAGNCFINSGGSAGRTLLDEDANGYRPRGIYISGMEMGKPYTVDPSHTDYGLGMESMNGNLVDLSAWDVVMEKMRFWGKGPGRFFHARGGRWDMSDFDGRYATWRFGGSMQVRAVTENTDGGWMRFRRGRLRSTDDCLQVNGGYVEKLGVAGTVLFEDIVAISEKNRALIIQLGGQSGSVLISNANHGHVIVNRCDLRGGANDVHVRVAATSGSVAGLTIKDSILRGRRDDQDDIIGDSAGGLDDEIIDESIVTDEGEESLVGQGASIQVIVTNHPDRVGPGLGRLVLDNVQIPAPGSGALLITSMIGIGRRLDGDGNPSRTGTLEWYDGQPNTTPASSVAKLNSVRDLIGIGTIHINKSCRFGKPRQWTPTGLHADGVTPRVKLPGHFGFNAVGTNQIDVNVVERARLHRGDGVLIAGSRVYFVPAGTNTGAASIQVRSGMGYVPITKNDGTTPTSGGEIVGGSFGMVGLQLNSNRTSFRVMTDEQMLAQLLPGLRGTPLVTIRSTAEAIIEAYQREVAAGQDGVAIGEGTAQVLFAKVAGRDVGLDIGPLYGNGPGTTPCWTAAATPGMVSGVRIDEVRNAIVTDGYSSTPLSATPHANVRPIEVTTPQVTTRRSGGIIIEKTDFASWPAAHTLLQGAGYDIGEANTWPSGALAPRTQLFDITTITGQFKISFRHATRLLLLQGDTTKTVTTLEPDLVASGPRRLVVSMLATSGRVTFTEAGNIRGVGTGGLVLAGANQHAEFEWDAYSTVWRLVGTNAPFSSGVALATVALTDAATISTNAALGNVFTVTLGGNRTLGNPTNLAAGMGLTWIVKQSGVGGRTLAFGDAFVWADGTAPTVSSAANSVTIFSAVYDGTTLRAGSALYFAS